MPRGQRSSRPKQPDAYRHDEAYRLNNPEAGLALYEASEAPQVHFEHRVTTDQPWDPRISRVHSRVWSGLRLGVLAVTPRPEGVRIFRFSVP